MMCANNRSKVTYIVKTPQKEQIINIPKKNRTDVNVEMLKRLTIKQLNLNCNDNHISLLDCIAKKEITDHNVDSLIQNSRLLFSIDKDKQYFNSLPNTTFDIRSGNSKEICKQFKKSILDPVIEAKNECKESQLTINVHDETSVEHLNHFLEFLVVRGTRHLLLSKKASKDGFSADASDGLNFHLKNRIEKLALILHAAITNIYTIVCLINYLTILGRKIKVIEIKDNDGGYSKLCEQPLKLQCASMSGLIQQAGETRVSLSKAYYSKLLAQAADDDCRLQAQEIRNVIEKRYDFDFTKIDDMKNNLNLDDNAENEAVQTQNVTMINENGNVREKIDKFRTHTTTTIASFFLEKNLRHRLLKLNDIVNYPQTSAAIVVKYSSRKEQDFKNNDSVIDTFGITHREFIEQMKKQVSVVECISLVDKYCIKNMNKQEGKIPGEFLPIVYCRESSGCIGASVDCLNSIENCIRSNADYFDLVIRAAAEGHCQALYALCFFDQLTKDFIYGNGQCTREVINSITRQKMCETIDHFINGNFLCVAYYTSNKTDVLDIMNVQADVSLIANSNLIALNSDEVKINSTMFESVGKFHRTESWLHEELHVKPRFFVDPMYESDTNNNENASAGIELAWGSEPTDENLRKITPNGYTTTSLNAKSVLAKFIYKYNDIGIRALTSYSRAGFELLELNKTPTVAVSNKSFANIVEKIVVEEKGTTKQLEWRHCTAPSESNDQLALMPCFL